MLVARGHKTLGLADFRWAFVFAPHVWSVFVNRQGLVLDSRFVPPSTEPSRGRGCLYLLLRGAWTLHDPGSRPIEAPCAFVLSEEQLEGVCPSQPFTFSAHGRPFRAIEIHASLDDLRRAPTPRPSPVLLEAPALAAAEALSPLADQSDASLERGDVALLAALGDQGLVTRGLVERANRPTPRPHAVLWAALRPMIERLYLNPTLDEVGSASGLSTRQLDRYVKSFVTTFGLVGDRWRASTLHLRLKLAVLLLSADGASIADVASTVGYGSPDAMGRAFRDARLPPPGTVQEALRLARRDDPATASTR